MKTLSSCVLAMSFVCCAMMAYAAAPARWILAASKPANYDTGVDSTVKHNAHPAAYLKANSAVTQTEDGCGTLRQSFRAEQYAGKRVRFRALAKTDAVSQWAG